MNKLVTCGVVLSLVLAATLTSANASSAQEPPMIEVDLTEFAIGLNPSSTPAGQVNFATTNSGEILHDLVVVRTDLAPDSLPMNGPRVDIGQLDVAGVVEPIEAGATDNSTFELRAGAYVLICNIAGHYQLGMYAVLTVSPPDSTAEPTQTPRSVPPAIDGVVLPHSGSGPSSHEGSDFRLLFAGAAALAATGLLFAGKGLRNR
jgi:uncharacterized cupredoxin-like copper-binding protein